VHPIFLERQDSLALGMVRVIGDTTLHRGASSGTWQRLPSTARNFLTRPTPSAPRRALLPGEHRFTGKPLFSTFLTRGGPIGLLLRASRKFPYPPLRATWSILDCARRTSTVSPCAFCEHEGHLAAPDLNLLVHLYRRSIFLDRWGRGPSFEATMSRPRSSRCSHRDRRRDF
jgi:hypothetical protein